MHTSHAKFGDGGSDVERQALLDSRVGQAGKETVLVSWSPHYVGADALSYAHLSTVRTMPRPMRGQPYEAP